MSDAADTARRERAEKYAKDREYDPHKSAYDLLIAHLSGAQEEAAIKDAEIAVLREAVRWCYDEGKLTREVEDAIDWARGRA